MFIWCIAFLLIRGIFCQGSNHDQSICTTEECVKTSQNILTSISSNISGCDDFYGHTCGNWIKNSTLPPSVDMWGHVQILRQKLIENLRDILEEPIFSNDTFAEKNTKRLYKTCMDIGAMNQTGTTVLESIIRNAGGWPMIETDHDSHIHVTSWENVHTHYARLNGIGAILNVHVISNDNANSTPIISLNQPNTIYGKYRSIRSNVKVNVYKEFIRNVSLILIASKMSNISLTSVEKDITDVIEFRNSLHEILDRRVRTQTAENDLNTIQALEDFTNNAAGQQTNVNWLSLIKNCFPEHVASTINRTEKVLVNERRYIERLIPLLKSTSVRTLINHIQLYFVEQYVKDTSSQMRMMAQILDSTIDGPQPVKERWEMCVATNQMKHVLSSMYVKRHFPRSSKDDLTAIAENLRAVLRIHINQSDWLDPDTKREALLKVDRMYMMIGYPDWYENQGKLRDYYRGQVVTTNYLRNVLNYMGNEYRIELLKLRNMAVRETYDDYPTDVNAYYSVTNNSILANAAYFQWPFYTRGGPPVVNYATAGTAIAHEMGHAFDTIGRMYNSLGKYTNWWTDQSSTTYNAKIDCINQMYNSFTAPERQPPLQMDNAAITVNENIADIIGLRVAFDAFKKKVNETPTDSLKTLQGFNSSITNKLFFFSYTSSLCEVFDVDAIETIMWTNDHNFARFRVNGPASLMPEFGEIFSCSVGSPMRPHNICTLWNS